MKVLVITGSPHKNGTSACLADRFIEGAKEAGHEVVRFDEENDQILFVPSLESIASDFDVGHVEREGDLLRLYASSESKGECVYVFDISNSMDQYLLVRVD